MITAILKDFDYRQCEKTRLHAGSCIALHVIDVKISVVQSYETDTGQLFTNSITMLISCRLQEIKSTQQINQ